MLPLILIPLAFAFGLAAHDAPRAPADRAPVVSAEPAVIVFENQAWDLATVYAVPQFGLPVRLGQVMPGGTTRLRVPRSVVSTSGAVEIVAVPFARNFSVRSGLVTLVAGEAVRASLSPAENILSVLPER
jgi:hypothetical protein